MQDYAEISVKLAIAFAGLWTITRLLGKREIAQLTPFDFVSSKGVIQPHGLAAMNRDEKWLRRELRSLGYADVRSVAFAEWTEEGKLRAIGYSS